MELSELINKLTAMLDVYDDQPVFALVSENGMVVELALSRDDNLGSDVPTSIQLDVYENTP